MRIPGNTAARMVPRFSVCVEGLFRPFRARFCTSWPLLAPTTSSLRRLSTLSTSCQLGPTSRQEAAFLSLVPLAERRVLQVEGPDAAAFLQGLITQDVRCLGRLSSRDCYSTSFPGPVMTPSSYPFAPATVGTSSPFSSGTTSAPVARSLSLSTSAVARTEALTEKAEGASVCEAPGALTKALEVSQVLLGARGAAFALLNTQGRVLLDGHIVQVPSRVRRDGRLNDLKGALRPGESDAVAGESGEREEAVAVESSSSDVSEQEDKQIGSEEVGEMEADAVFLLDIHSAVKERFFAFLQRRRLSSRVKISEKPEIRVMQLLLLPSVSFSPLLPSMPVCKKKARTRRLRSGEGEPHGAFESQGGSRLSSVGCGIVFDGYAAETKELEQRNTRLATPGDGAPVQTTEVGGSSLPLSGSGVSQRGQSLAEGTGSSLGTERGRLWRETDGSTVDTERFAESAGTEIQSGQEYTLRKAVDREYGWTLEPAQTRRDTEATCMGLQAHPTTEDGALKIGGACHGGKKQKVANAEQGHQVKAKQTDAPPNLVVRDGRSWRMGLRLYVSSSGETPAEHVGGSHGFARGQPSAVPCAPSLASTPSSSPDMAPVPAVSALSLDVSPSTRAPALFSCPLLYSRRRLSLAIPEGPLEVGIQKHLLQHLNMEWQTYIYPSVNKGCFIGQEVVTRALLQLTNRRRLATFVLLPNQQAWESCPRSSSEERQTPGTSFACVSEASGGVGSREPPGCAWSALPPPRSRSASFAITDTPGATQQVPVTDEPAGPASDRALSTEVAKAGGGAAAHAKGGAEQARADTSCRSPMPAGILERWSFLLRLLDERQDLRRQEEAATLTKSQPGGPSTAAPEEGALTEEGAPGPNPREKDASRRARSGPARTATECDSHLPSSRDCPSAPPLKLFAYKCLDERVKPPGAGGTTSGRWTEVGYVLQHGEGLGGGRTRRDEEEASGGPRLGDGQLQCGVGLCMLRTRPGDPPLKSYSDYLEYVGSLMTPPWPLAIAAKAPPALSPPLVSSLLPAVKASDTLALRFPELDQKFLEDPTMVQPDRTLQWNSGHGAEVQWCVVGPALYAVDGWLAERR